MRSRQTVLASTGIACIFIALAGWVFYIRGFAGLHGDDWMVFYTAARMSVEGHAASVFDGDRLTSILNARFAHWLARPLTLHPFLYPPHYLLLLAPFAWIPPLPALAVFLVATFAGLVTALSRYAQSRRDIWIYGFAALLCPASAIVFNAGQNTFLTLALLIGGMALCERRPVSGGILLGVLTFKPQLWLMVPPVLLALRQWKSLGIALATSAVLIVASIAIFGMEPWRAWFGVLTGGSELYARWSAETRIHGLGTYNYALFLGAPGWLAGLTQAAAAAASAVLVYRVHRRPAPPDLRLAIVLAATFFAAPNMLIYDAMTIELAAALLFVYALRNPTPLVDVFVAAPVFLITLVNPPTVFRAGIVTPFLAALLLGLLVRRSATAGDPAAAAAETAVATG